MNASRYLGLPIALATLVSAANLLPQRYWIQEQLSNLGAVFLFFHVAACLVLVSLYRGRTRSILMAANVLLLGLYAGHVAPFFLSAPRIESAPLRELRFVYMNGGGEFPCDAIESLPGARRPDILAVVGGGAGRCGALDFASSVRKDAIAVFSDYELSDPSLEGLGEGVRSDVLEVDARLNDRRIVLSVFSAPVPHDDRSSYETLLTSRRLASRFRHRIDDAILAGDLRATLFSIRYQKLLVISGMDDAMHGFGITTGRQRLAFLPTEHILYKGGLTPLRFVGVDAPSGERVGYEVVFALAAAEETA